MDSSSDSCASRAAGKRSQIARLNSIAALIACALVTPTLAEDSPPTWVIDARQGAQELGGQLKQALVGAIEADGVIAAIDVCQMQAPAIAGRVSTSNMDVGRTALRVRNPANRADSWEKRMLEDFERRLDRGEDPAGMDVFAIRHVDGERRGHWMKPIPTGGLCLSCHGTDLDPELQSAIDQRYPQDQATGFSAGSLRGAFSVEIELTNPD